jgi:hypothetical protein
LIELDERIHESHCDQNSSKVSIGEIILFMRVSSSGGMRSSARSNLVIDAQEHIDQNPGYDQQNIEHGQKAIKVLE